MSRRVDNAAGFSLPELMLVTTLLAIMAMFLMPMVNERVRVIKVRTMVNQFALDLSAARWTAVAGRAPVNLIVNAEPVNRYEYTDVRGKLRRVRMPTGVRIVSSTNPIQFRPNGSVLGGSITVIEMQLADDRISRWTVETNSLGIPKTIHRKVAG